MASIPLNIILEKIEELKYPYFIVWHQDGKTRMYQNLDDAEATPERSRALLESFLKHTSGTVQITLQAKSAMNQGDTRAKVHFTCYLPGAGTSAPADPFISGTGSHQNTDKLLELQRINYENQIAALREQHRRDLEMEALKREMKEIKESDFFTKHQDTIAGLLPLLFRGGATPVTAVAGIPETEEGPAMAILEQLSQLDPEYLKHLEMLCKLAQNNPEMYRQGINMIEKMI